jgi:hypothetical protein
MKPDTRRSWARNLAACALGLSMCWSVGAMAAIPPSIAYQFSSQPMISGSVVSVNDREMVVNTDQGEQVTLLMDSRTMVPRDLAPGMVMRAEFVAQEDCRFYARRIIPIRDGMSTNRSQAYAGTHDSPEAIASSTSMATGNQPVHGQMMADAQAPRSTPEAASPSAPGANMTPVPGSADDWFSSRPMISGRVMAINDHRLVVETEQGKQVGLVMDSRTMVPGEVAPGSMMRAEFTQMKDGRYYANRIAVIEPGTVAREQAYAHTRDSDVEIARTSADCGFTTMASGNNATSTLEPRQQPAEARNAATGPVATQAPVAARAAEEPKVLPPTGSDQPLLLLAGLLALGGAGVIAAVRGFRAA